MSKYFFFAALAVAITFSSCTSSRPTGKGSATPKITSGETQKIAADAAMGVGVTGKSADGNKGVPVIILEESHNSRVSQIQHAVTLVRLYEKYHLRDIALEGYLKERPKLDTSRFSQDWPKLKRIDRAELAAQLLKEGEISAAEFMAIVYEDVTLHPIESRQDYNVTLTEEEVEGLDAMLAAVKNPKAQEIGAKYNDDASITSMPGESHLAMAEELEAIAKKEGVNLNDQNQKRWESWLSFWRGRVQGSQTMVTSTNVISDRPKGKITAMSIGFLHTEGICKLLEKEGRSYCVVTPRAKQAKDERGDLSIEQINRKYERKSVFSAGELAQLLNSLNSTKKPEPVLNEPWFIADSEIRSVTKQIVDAVLGGRDGNPPPPPGPPFDFGEGEFRKRMIYVPPKSIQLVQDPPPNGQYKAVFFTLILNPDNPAMRKTLYVKAMHDINYKPDPDSEEDIAKLLLKLIPQVQGEAKSSTSVEDSFGRVQIGRKTVAVIGGDKKKVLATKLLPGI